MLVAHALPQSYGHIITLTPMHFVLLVELEVIVVVTGVVLQKVSRLDV